MSQPQYYDWHAFCWEEHRSKAKDCIFIWLGKQPTNVLLARCQLCVQLWFCWIDSNSFEMVVNLIHSRNTLSTLNECECTDKDVDMLYIEKKY